MEKKWQMKGKWLHDLIMEWTLHHWFVMSIRARFVFSLLCKWITNQYSVSCYCDTCKYICIWISSLTEIARLPNLSIILYNWHIMPWACGGVPYASAEGLEFGWEAENFPLQGKNYETPRSLYQGNWDKMCLSLGQNTAGILKCLPSQNQF